MYESGSSLSTRLNSTKFLRLDFGRRVTQSEIFKQAIMSSELSTASNSKSVDSIGCVSMAACMIAHV